jgi:hypothetical protein
MSAQIQCNLVCDGCGDKIFVIEKAKEGWSFTHAKAKDLLKKAEWITKNEGSKGVKHYCPTCTYSIPDIARWHATRTLLK